MRQWAFSSAAFPIVRGSACESEPAVPGFSSFPLIAARTRWRCRRECMFFAFWTLGKIPVTEDMH